VATDVGDEREAGQATANLWSGFGYLDSPIDVLRTAQVAFVITMEHVNSPSGPCVVSLAE